MNSSGLLPMESVDVLFIYRMYDSAGG